MSAGYLHYAKMFSTVAVLLYACSGDDAEEGSAPASEGSARSSQSASESADSSTQDAEVATGSGSSVATAVSDIDANTDAIVVSGPISGGKGEPFRSAAVYAEEPFSAASYVEEEFFYEGGAVSYVIDGDKGSDGKWAMKPESEAPYRTRLLVRRPMDADRFNGTVVVEWLNVSAGADGDPGFMYNFEEILREGYGYVGVSAQQVGVQGGGFAGLIGGGDAAAKPLKDADPDRYASLTHPGDGYSYDIFTRAARVIRGEGGMDVMGGLEPKYLLAYGESQSAGRMVAYVDGIHPMAKAYDGYFIHSRGPTDAGFGNSLGGFGGFSLGAGGGGTLIRDDIDVPVFQFQTEGDVFGMGSFVSTRQPNSDVLRTWEVAGTAHADQYLLDFGEGMEGAVQCEDANDGPQWYVLRAALHSLHAWVADGSLPPTPEPIEADDSGSAPKRDELGNALGGVRTPAVDVPVTKLSGTPSEAGGNNFFCFLFGSTEPFSPEQLKELYPTHEDYVEKFKQAAEQALEGGFLLQPELDQIVAQAEQAPVPE